jgi:hypothetical protein
LHPATRGDLRFHALGARGHGATQRPAAPARQFEIAIPLRRGRENHTKRRFAARAAVLIL